MQYGGYKGVSANGAFLAYVPSDQPMLRIVNLETNQISAEIASTTLRFLNFEYDRLFTQFLPNSIGNAVFIDVTEGCVCERENDGILVIDNGQPKIFPLPNVAEFEWLPGEGLKYRYKSLVFDESICAGTEGECIGLKASNEWIVGQVDINSVNFLESWDGYNKLQ